MDDWNMFVHLILPRKRTASKHSAALIAASPFPNAWASVRLRVPSGPNLDGMVSLETVHGLLNSTQCGCEQCWIDFEVCCPDFAHEEMDLPRGVKLYSDFATVVFRSKAIVFSDRHVAPIASN